MPSCRPRLWHVGVQSPAWSQTDAAARVGDATPACLMGPGVLLGYFLLPSQLLSPYPCQQKRRSELLVPNQAPASACLAISILLCRGAAGCRGRQNTARPLPMGKGRAGQSLSPPKPITSSRVLQGAAAARGPLPAVPRSGDSALPAPGTAARSPGVIEMQTARAPRQSGWRERPCKLALHATYGSFVEVMRALCLTGERFICSQAEASVADRDSPVVLPLSGVKLQYKTCNR